MHRINLAFHWETVRRNHDVLYNEDRQWMRLAFCVRSRKCILVLASFGPPQLKYHSIIGLEAVGRQGAYCSGGAPSPLLVFRQFESQAEIDRELMVS